MSDVPADRIQPWIGRVVAVMAIAVALFLGLTIWTGLDRLGDSLSVFPWASDLGTILGLVLAGWSIRALRWHYYTRYLRWQVPILPSTLAFLASFAFTATPGKAGEVVKAGLLRGRYGVAVSETGGVLLAERLGDMLAVLLLAAGGLTIVADTRIYYSICLVGVGGLTLLIRSERIHRPVFLRLGRLPRMGPIADKALQLFETGRRLLSPKPFATGFALATAAWACEALAFHLILDGFGLDLPILTSFSIYGISTLIGALSMLPGGVGGVEATMFLLLHALDVGASEALGPVVLIRTTTLWFVSLLGFGFMGIWWLTMGSPDRAQVLEQDRH